MLIDILFIQQPHYYCTISIEINDHLALLDIWNV